MTMLTNEIPNAIANSKYCRKNCYFDPQLNSLSENDLFSARMRFNEANNSKLEVIHVLYNIVQGFRMISFITVTPKAKALKFTKGYKLAYVYNLDCPECSEFGEVYIDVNDQIPCRIS